MFILDWPDLLGYAASVLIAASMAMHSIVRLRWIGMAGAILFAVYGIFIQSIPVILLNVFTAGAHIYHLVQIKTKKEYFELMAVPSVETPFFKRFVKFHEKDLLYYFPQFSNEQLKKPFIYFVFRNMNPAALFIAQHYSPSTLEIVVDFVTPDFRDMKNAHYIFYRAKKVFGNKGYSRFRTRAFVREHQKYLQKMNFEPVSENGKIYFEKNI